MIEVMSLAELAPIVPGQLHGDDISFNQLSIDTRTIKSGDLYLALEGEHFDGHKFIADAVDKGCSGLVVSKASAELEELSKPYLLVNNTESALASIAATNRQRFKGALIGLTGSSGKTSTKNMLAAVLAERACTAATKGNYNNEIGVPLTLLALSPEHEFSVVEMGARAPGDIRYLSNIAKPDVALVLNAGEAHLEIFGDYETIVATKGEIYDSLGESGVGVVNFDDPAHAIWSARLGGKKIISFSSQSNKADVYATSLRCHAEGSEFELYYRGKSIAVSLPTPGRHQVQNALATAAVSVALGLSLKEVSLGLSKVASSEGRMASIDLANVRILDDSYNANPTSMKAALDVLAMQSGYCVAVLGEMAELGDYAEKMHLELAAYAKQSKVNYFYFVGPYAQAMAAYVGDRARAVETKQELVDFLLQDQSEQKTVLVKGSRSAAMDDVVNMIKRRIQ